MEGILDTLPTISVHLLFLSSTAQKETTLTDMLIQKLSSLLGIRQHQKPASEKHADSTGYRLLVP